MSRDGLSSENAVVVGNTTTTTTTTGLFAKHFDISHLPSLKDGMTIEEEASRRRKTCRFIEEAGRVLKLPRVAVSTAMVFFHRFYAKHSFADHDRFEVAVACIVLAAKTEESPKKLNVVMEECYKLKVRGMQAGRISAPAGAVAASSTAGALDPKSEEFIKLKERILLLERVILHTIGFELSIDHPYKFLVEQIKMLIHKRQLEYIAQPTGEASSTAAADSNNASASTSQVMSKMLNEMVQCAMNIANDSMQTSLCLQFDPQRIATACVYMAGHICKVRPTQGRNWWQVLGQPDLASLASITCQLLELLAERKLADSSVYTKLRQELDQWQQPEPPSSTGSSSRPPPPSTETGGRTPPPPPPSSAGRGSEDTSAPDPKRPRLA